MTRILLSLLALSAPVVAAAELPTLAELAARADVVAVVQLVHTEYRPRTGPPKAGFALLRVLIPYKRLDRQDLLAVYAEDTDPNPCFYPTEPDADERYLVFLHRREDGQYQGEAPYCWLPVHVIADDGEYALRWPLAGVRTPPGIEGEPLIFADRGAHLDPSRLDPAQLAETLSLWPAEPLPDGRYRFSQGIRLTVIRPHIFPDGLPPPPHRSRPYSRAPAERAQQE